ncbi:RRP15-like protein [Microplitis demolitor]|uniref:RRP15-like protein n=1 Tax=Microplitis demolitor TaxID=69319 RepID=UPI0004CDB667|nr:RRP15-like protein [Microplitis demolitor]XP_008544850.1 RRP15-like protein [Microplitis demolitor]XP_008544858.1 RRP15-like protein [Microplitis demolitor]XP_053594802.1 RRP15-like protein [Microplitis demolitor]XP_053594803.1 RRP15-like protein [Microplitis demolitor]
MSVEEMSPENSSDDSEREDSEMDDSETETKESGSKFNGNPALADVFRKILKTNKPKKKKTLVLSRAKKLNEIKPKESEADADAGADAKADDKSEVKKFTEDPEKKEKKSKHLSLRVKPSVLSRGRERTLQKIATKGVVQLFNIVYKQQMEIEQKLEDAGPLMRKQEKVLESIDKNTFLDHLMGGTKSITT